MEMPSIKVTILERENKLLRHLHDQIRQHTLLLAGATIILLAGFIQIPSPLSGGKPANAQAGLLTDTANQIADFVPHLRTAGAKHALLASAWQSLVVASAILSFMIFLLCLRIYRRIPPLERIHPIPEDHDEGLKKYCKLLETENRTLSDHWEERRKVLRLTIRLTVCFYASALGLMILWGLFGAQA